MRKKKKKTAIDLTFSCCVLPNLLYSIKVPKTTQDTVFLLPNSPTEASASTLLLE